MINKVAKCSCVAARISSKWSATSPMQFHHRFDSILRPRTTDPNSRRSLHLTGCGSHRMEFPAVTSVLVEDKLKATVLLDPEGWPNWLKEAPCLESLPHLMDFTTKCRQAQWKVGFLEMQQGLRGSGSTYIVGIRYSFTDVTSTSKSLPVTQNLHPRFSTRLVHCGKSSLDLFSTLQLNDSSSPIFDHLLKFVYVGKKRTEPLPDWFHANYGHGLDEKPGAHFKELEQSHVKCERHAKSFTVLPSHIDIFGHANHIVYIKFITDTIGDLLCRNKNDSGLLREPLSGMEIFYAGDCFESDVLKVTLLECSDGKREFLGAKISKEVDDSVIVHFRATFKGDVISCENLSML